MKQRGSDNRQAAALADGLSPAKAPRCFLECSTSPGSCKPAARGLPGHTMEGPPPLPVRAGLPPVPTHNVLGQWPELHKGLQGSLSSLFYRLDVK